MPDWFDGKIAATGTVQHNDYTHAILSNAKGHDHPWMINIAGTAGTGKSTMCTLLHAHPLLGEFNPPLIQFDAIMTHYPAYHADCTALGNEAAFTKWELIARATGFDLIRQLIEKCSSFIFEYSCSDDSYDGMLHTLKGRGYRTAIAFMTSDLDVCTARVAMRMQETGRHTPPEYIHGRHEKIMANLQVFRPLVDFYTEIDNSTTTPPDTSWVVDFMSAAR